MTPEQEVPARSAPNPQLTPARLILLPNTTLPSRRLGEVYRYTLEGSGSDPLNLRTLQEWTVQPRLRQVPGVADVVSYGGLVREIHVEPHPTKMASLGVGLSDVFIALQKASANATGGYVERGSEMFVIRSLCILRDLSDIEKVRVAYHQGIPLLVRAWPVSANGMRRGKGSSPATRTKTPWTGSSSCAGGKTRRSCSTPCERRSPI
jgi:Cu/Ag efflux pump CusA